MLRGRRGRDGLEGVYFFASLSSIRQQSLLKAFVKAAFPEVPDERLSMASGFRRNLVWRSVLHDTNAEMSRFLANKYINAVDHSLLGAVLGPLQEVGGAFFRVHRLDHIHVGGGNRGEGFDDTSRSYFR